jgi:dCMP deaminase
MQRARQVALENSLDKRMPTGCVIRRDATVLSWGANGSTHHLEHGCERARLGVPTGERYDLCEGCQPHNHSEHRAIVAAQAARRSLEGGVLYLWGHYGCCIACWELIIAARIMEVCILENAEPLFNRHHPRNIIGRQWES